jgi:quinol monooxygenase YgiN
MQMVHVLAVITAKPGMRDRILEIFRANVPAVRAEDGCIEYTATIDHHDAGSVQTKFGDDTFVVVEQWQSLDALKAHAAAPHMAAYAAKTRDLIASRIIHVLSPT